ncbi:MAG: thioredoxin family protein [Phycisphaerae bacterium]|nr:thioredoxin family protein [Phycisphaerae bacterium]
MTSTRLGLLAAAGLISAWPHAVEAAARPPLELGQVKWQRGLESALEKSRSTGKPVLVLFQEVPGCATCVNFGQQVMSHPLIVEAVETDFIPVLVFNNRKGEDQKLLKRFSEPAWNNPVVRYLDGRGQDLVARQDRIWAVAPTAGRMIAALAAAGRPVPKYLQAVAAWENPKALKKATFAMGCFWTGEARLGSLGGVVGTRVGWMDRQEVVEVTYDPQRIAYAKLVESAQSMQCAGRVYAAGADDLAVAKKLAGDRARLAQVPARDAKSSDQYHALRRTAYRYLPLTSMQATKINAALVRKSRDTQQWLSPRQRQMLVEIVAAVKADRQSLAGVDLPRNDAAVPIAHQRLHQRLAELRPAGAS